MKKKTCILLISLSVLCFVVWRIATVERLITVKSGVHIVMGTFARLVVIAENETVAQSGIKAALDAQKQVDKLMSYHREDSELAKINAQAYDHPVVVAPETMVVLQEAVHISQITHGAFDVSVGPLIDLWKQAGDTNTPPTKTQISEARAKVDYTQIILDPNAMTVAFGRPGMKLDLGGIAKGYAIDLCIQAVKDHGAAGAMVDIGGDIFCYGKAPRSQKSWRIALQDPQTANAPLTNQIKLILNVTDRAVTTSGHYQRFELVGSDKVSHIIDTYEGTGSKELASVTILAPTAIVADALATAVSVLGHEKGLALIESLPDTEAIVIDADGATLDQTSNAKAYTNVQ